MKNILVILLFLSQFIVADNDTPKLRYVTGRLRNTGRWSDLDVTVCPTGPAKPDIRAIAVAPDGSVYIGGEFTGWDGIAGRDYIARYIPGARTWHTVGNRGDINGIVEVLELGPDGMLYVAGSFINAGGDSNADYFAQWNGVAFSAVGNMETAGNAAVQAVAVADSGDIYIGGQFTNWAGIAAADKIAYWDKSAAAWRTVGTGMDNAVFALAFDAAGNLYAGGSFTSAGGTGARHIAVWDGSNWVQVGGGLNDSVMALQIGSSGLELFVAGEFTDTYGGVEDTLNYIVRWTGAVFETLGTGANNDVFALALGPDGMLYAGGSFTTIGGLNVGRNRGAKWDGHVWSHLGIDLPESAQVLSYAIDDQGPISSYDIIVGFDTAVISEAVVFFPAVMR